MPRIEVTLEDASGSTKGIIMDAEAEDLLSLTTEEIYERASTEVLSDSAQHEQPHIPATPFKIQVKKSYARSARPMTPRVLILAITDEGNMLGPSSAAETGNIDRKNSKDQKWKSSAPMKRQQNQRENQASPS